MRRRAAVLMLAALAAAAGCAPATDHRAPPPVIEIGGADPVTEDPFAVLSVETGADVRLGLTIITADRLASIPGLGSAQSTALAPRMLETERQTSGGCGPTSATTDVAGAVFHQPVGPGEVAMLAVHAVRPVDMMEAGDIAAALRSVRPGCRVDSARMRDSLLSIDGPPPAERSPETVIQAQALELSEGQAWVIDTVSPEGPGRLAAALVGDDFSVIIVERPAVTLFSHAVLAAIFELAITRSVT